MKPTVARLGWVLALVTVTGVCAPARAEDHYVAPDGDDANAGTKDKPFATVEKGQSVAAPGDTVFIRGGVYELSGTTATIGVAFTKSGQSGKPIQYFAYPGEVPIFDLFELKPQQRVTGLDVHCNWIHIRGLEVRGVRQLIVGDSWSVRIRGDHNVIEQLNVHDGEAPGIFITSGASNLILNCDSHHNYDPLEDGGNADGFGCHSPGGDNVLRGCRAYENSDDGFDFINAAGTCTVEQSWSFRNGFIPDTMMTGANGAGFKAGGYGEPPATPATGAARHVVRENLAFGNRVIGFYANHHPGGIDFFNNTAFDNPNNFDMLTPADGTKSTHKLRNNVAVPPGKAIVDFNGGTDDFNSWTLPVTVANSDFTGMDKAQALLPRQADGSLPDVAFMHLADGSDLIDRGEDVGLPFTGSAPDLGAFERGATTTTAPIDAGAPDPMIATDAGTSSPSAGGSQSPPPSAGATQPTGGSTQPPGTAAGAQAMQPAGSAAPPPMTSAGASAPAASGGNGAGGDDSSSGGCGCRVTPSRPTANGLLVLLAALWLGVRARLVGSRRRFAAARQSRRSRLQATGAASS